jgi:adenylate cyclase
MAREEIFGPVLRSSATTRWTKRCDRQRQHLRPVGCEAHDGRVVKTLGDGVLAVFPRCSDAVAAVVELQRNHLKRILNWPPKLRMRLQVGVASGEVVEVDGDCYGDAVNVASRLSDLSGADQIWATDSVIEQVPEPGEGVRFRSLGPISIRGKAEQRVIYRIEWQEEVVSALFTAPASLDHLNPRGESAPGQIELNWLDVNATFKSGDMPIHLGRVSEADFVVNDQRVSRLHAKIEWRDNHFVLSDLSSYGTWVKFAGSDTELALRRGECVLHGNGDIALGAPFSDFTVPTVSFNLSGGSA